MGNVGKQVVLAVTIGLLVVNLVVIAVEVQANHCVRAVVLAYLCGALTWALVMRVGRGVS